MNAILLVVLVMVLAALAGIFMASLARKSKGNGGAKGIKRNKPGLSSHVLREASVEHPPAKAEKKVVQPRKPRIVNSTASMRKEVSKKAQLLSRPNTSEHRRTSVALELVCLVNRESVKNLAVEVLNKTFRNRQAPWQVDWATKCFD